MSVLDVADCGRRLAQRKSTIAGRSSGVRRSPSLLRFGLPIGSLESGVRNAAITARPLPALHPQMAETYRQKVMTLALALERDAQREFARQTLRGFLQSIVI